MKSIGLIGLGLAWKWELTGGIIALVTFVVLAISDYIATLPASSLSGYCHIINFFS